MSVMVTVPLAFPLIKLLATGALLASGKLIEIALERGQKVNMKKVESHTESHTETSQGKNSVDLAMGNAGKVIDGVGQSMTFSGDGVTVVFRQDASGNTGVTVHGDRDEEELREIGEKLASAIIQQYAYHRIVTEMKGRGMNIVEEEVEEDGTVRMHVRVYQG